MAIADRVRIMLGKLNPGEIAERDTAARRRTEAADVAAERLREATEADAKQRKAVADFEQQRAVHHHQLLARSAAIGTLTLVCHQDTWNWLKHWMNYVAGIRTYYDWWHHYEAADRVVPDSAGMLKVQLSGHQITEVLDRLTWVQQWYGVAKPDERNERPSPAAQAEAARLYQAIGDVVAQVNPAAAEGKMPVAILDARAADDGGGR